MKRYGAILTNGESIFTGGRGARRNLGKDQSAFHYRRRRRTTGHSASDIGGSNRVVGDICPKGVLKYRATDTRAVHQSVIADDKILRTGSPKRCAGKQECNASQNR